MRLLDTAGAPDGRSQTERREAPAGGKLFSAPESPDQGVCALGCTIRIKTDCAPLFQRDVGGRALLRTVECPHSADPVTRGAMNEERTILRILDDAGELCDLRIGRGAVHRNVDIADARLADGFLFNRGSFVGSAEVDDGGETERLQSGNGAVPEHARSRDVRPQPASALP